MKAVYILLLTYLIGNNGFAQSVELPNYYVDEYSSTEIYTYYGSLPFNGVGDIYLGGQLSEGFITGVEFKVVVDSINEGGLAGQTAFRDSLGYMVPVNTGDIINLPVSFQLFGGEIGFHVVIEGTPEVYGEEYFCELLFLFNLGDDFGMQIITEGDTFCTVDQIDGLAEFGQIQGLITYPNPFTHATTVSFDKVIGESYNFYLYDMLGKEVRQYPNITTNQFILEKESLNTGTFMYQLRSASGDTSTGKLVIE